MGSQVALVKGNCQIGFQVDRATHILWFWLKEVVRWDLKLTKKKRREKEEKEKRRKRERVRSLDEWIFSKLGRQVFFIKLTMQNIEEFCFVSMVKRGHLLLPNFDPCFDNFSEKIQK
jgi:hypothetical protein